MYGYAGKILIADLTSCTYEVRALDPQLARDFVGGPSLGARLLYELMPANTPVFAPESVIGFVSGPTNGTMALMGGRYTVVSKSPVTGGFNDANSGGTFGARLRKSGYDAVFVKGISETPVYIYINNGEVSFRDASHLWGRVVSETENAIKAELGDKNAGIAMIGPGGERLSNIAAVMNDMHRAAARGGSGAVMGSKRLKALVCSGNVRLEAADPERVRAMNREISARGLPKPFTYEGTGADTEHSIMLGDMSVANWAESTAELTEEQINAIIPLTMDPKFKLKKYACNACVIGCGAIYKIFSGEYDIPETSRPEYETVGTFGTQMRNYEPESISICNWLCNEYGYDTISCGATVAWLMECYENGLFTKEELGGIELTWGNSGAITAMTRKICDNEGVGAALSMGSREAARLLGRGAEYLVTASGIEFPMHDPRFAPGLARTYQYDPTPGRHVKGGLGPFYGNNPPEVKYSYEGTGKDDVDGVIDSEITNLCGFCIFGGMLIRPGENREYINAITGFDYSDEEWLKLGLRSFTIRDAFNLREGMRRGDCDISPRILGDPPLTAGPTEGVTVDNEKLADNFFGELGWDVATALPTESFIRDVGGLDFLIADVL